LFLKFFDLAGISDYVNGMAESLEFGFFRYVDKSHSMSNLSRINKIVLELNLACIS